MISSKIYNQNSQLVYNLFKSGRNDINIIALILCESYFRKSLDRLIEYIAMPILFVFRKKRFSKLSIGIGQIQLKHWENIQEKQSPISINSFQKYLSTFENYDLLKMRVEENLGNDFSDSKLIAFHTGETRSFHYKLFQELKSRIKLHLTMYIKNSASHC